MAQRTDRLLGFTVIAVLIIGCLAVLAPFVTALLLAMILAYASWPLNLWLRRVLWHSPTLAAAVMTLAAALVIIGPFVIVALSLADNATELGDAFRKLVDHGLPGLPQWVTGLPVVGQGIETYWESIAHDTSRLLDLLRGWFYSSAQTLLAGGGLLARGLVQLGLAVFVAFFLFRNGEYAAERMRRAADRLGSARGRYLLQVAGNTVIGVVYGILGTALAQGVLAAIGFLIAGVPGAFLLGLATFFVSIVPVGPPLIWGTAAIWLFYQGSVGWAVFMALWGALVISMVDNFLKPIIISRGSSLPFVLVFLGVLGGVVAFGFIGVFLGPTLLAVGYRVVNEWVDSSQVAVAQPEAGERPEKRAE
jgi:predicted PurR-regulated permease PerM